MPSWPAGLVRDPFSAGWKSSRCWGLLPVAVGLGQRQRLVRNTGGPTQMAQVWWVRNEEVAQLMLRKIFQCTEFLLLMIPCTLYLFQHPALMREVDLTEKIIPYSMHHLLQSLNSCWKHPGFFFYEAVLGFKKYPGDIVQSEFKAQWLRGSSKWGGAGWRIYPVSPQPWGILGHR